MSDTIVTKEGFSADTLEGWLEPQALDTAEGGALAVRLPSDAAARDLAPHLNRIAAIAVTFPSFHDGRGFSLARRLRGMGFAGRLRAEGHVIVDQFAHALSVGFDEVAIDPALAERQPEEQWVMAAETALPDYRRKLAG